MSSLGPLPTMSAISRRSISSPSGLPTTRPRSSGVPKSAGFDVDEDALDGLLGSDSESVAKAAPRSSARPRVERRRTARRWGATDSENDSNNGSEDDSQPKLKADIAATAFHSRPLPTKKPSTAPSGSVGSDSIDAVLASLASVDADARVLPSPTMPVRARSRTIETKRGYSNDWDSSAANDDSARAFKREEIRAALQKATPEDSPMTPKRTSYNFETDSTAASSGGAMTSASTTSTVLPESVSDRRAKYREMMRKKREERTSIDSTPVAAPANTPPAAAPVKATDPWAGLNDPLAELAEPSTAASAVSAAIAASKSIETAASTPFLPRPIDTMRAETENTKQHAVSDNNAQTLGRRKPLGRRAALASTQPIAETVEQHNPMPQSATNIHGTNNSVTTTAAGQPVPMFDQWCQWLGLNANDPADSICLSIAHRAAKMHVPAHCQYDPQSGWRNSRTGRHYPKHPALGRWKRKVTDRRLAAKFNVIVEDSEDEPSSFWNANDTETEEELQQQAEPVVGPSTQSIMPLVSAVGNPRLAAPTPTSEQPQHVSTFALTSMAPLPALVAPTQVTRPAAPPSASMPLPPFPVAPLPTLVVTPPAFTAPPTTTDLTNGLDGGNAALLLAEQRRRLTSHYESHIAQLHATINAYQKHIHSIEAQYSTIQHHCQSLISHHQNDRELTVQYALEKERQHSQSLLEHQSSLHALTIEQLNSAHRHELQSLQQRYDGEMKALKHQSQDLTVLSSLSQHIEHSAQSIATIQAELARKSRLSLQGLTHEQEMREKLLGDRQSYLERQLRELKTKEDSLSDREKSLLADRNSVADEWRALKQAQHDWAEESKLSRANFNTEKEFFLTEKSSFLSEKKAFERQLFVEREELKIQTELRAQKESEMNEWWEEAHQKRQTIMLAVEAEKTELKDKNQLLELKRRTLDDEEHALVAEQQQLAQERRLIEAKMAELQRVGDFVHQQSEILVQRQEQHRLQQRASMLTAVTGADSLYRPTGVPSGYESLAKVGGTGRMNGGAVTVTMPSMPFGSASALSREMATFHSTHAALLASMNSVH